MSLNYTALKAQAAALSDLLAHCQGHAGATNTSPTDVNGKLHDHLITLLVAQVQVIAELEALLDATVAKLDALIVWAQNADNVKLKVGGVPAVL